ncbi:MAG: hypothetical protein IMY72_11935 [Bacteroidetes bacterium]|nr:hypothetical protein [Bacteroidota bacterium]
MKKTKVIKSIKRLIKQNFSNNDIVSIIYHEYRQHISVATIFSLRSEIALPNSEKEMRYKKESKNFPLIGRYL